MAKHVRNQILAKIRAFKYYAYVWPYSRHISFWAVVRSNPLRDCWLQYKRSRYSRSFHWLHNHRQKGAAEYEHVIRSKLQVDALNFDDCRSQTYDNAAVMSEHLTELQARLVDKNPKPVLVNCDNHSLNHAGVQATSVNPIIVTFVGTIEQVYVFFSSSTGRWTQMTDTIPVTVKSESDTRRKARAAAVRVIANSFDELVVLLQTMNEDVSKSSDARQKAGHLINILLNLFHIVCFYIFEWHLVVQKRLQSPRMNLREAAADIDSLKRVLCDRWSRLCQSSVETWLWIAKEWGISTEWRIRRIQKQYGEEARDSKMTASTDIDRVMTWSVDTLLSEIETMSKRSNGLNAQFGFLMDVAAVIGIDDLESLRKHCADFTRTYEGDIDGSCLMQEIIDCHMRFRNRQCSEAEKPQTP